MRNKRLAQASGKKGKKGKESSFLSLALKGKEREGEEKPVSISSGRSLRWKVGGT